MSVDRRRSTSNENGQRRRAKNKNLAAGRSGPGWEKCRREVIARAGGVCQACGRPLVPSAPAGTVWATEVDHYPVPLRIIEKDFKEGRISLETFNGRANDPNGCQALHKRCHIDRDLVTPSTTGPLPDPPRTRSPEWDDL